MIVTINKVQKSIGFGLLDAKSRKIKAKYTGCADKWVPGLSRKTGLLQTGLSKEEEKEFENKLRLPEGTLSPSSKYWDTFFIIIPEEGLTLDTELDEHLLQYKILTSDPTIVEGREKLKTTANAEYLIESEEGEAKNQNKQRSVIAKAYSIFYGMTQSDVIDALFMFGKDAKNITFEVAQNRLGEIVEESPSKFLEVVGDKLFTDKVWVMKLIKEGIVKKHGAGKGANQPLYFEDILLGANLDEAVAYLKAKENQNVYKGLKKALGEE